MATNTSELNLVAVGASAGGVEALKDFAAGLPPDLTCAILVVLHVPAAAPSVLARILGRYAPLPTTEAVDGEPLQAGTIRVAVPNWHLAVDNHRVALSQGPTENGHRPAINTLFRSAALSFGRRAIGVLLSGVLDDGTLGSAAIRSRGGTTIAQSPDDALFPAMPLSAIRAGVVDHVSNATEVGGLLEQLAARNFEERQMKPDPRMELENRIAMARRFVIERDAETLGPPSGYTCPDCSGSLMTVGHDNFRCRVGHAWTADALLRARDDEVENAMGIAIRSLEEKARLSRRLAEQVARGALSERYDAIAEEAEHATAVLTHRLSQTEPGQWPAHG
jgi:two-component system, chemotaxis family, protein-glutamate methylesterase/glutaminase